MFCCLSRLIYQLVPFLPQLKIPDPEILLTFQLLELYLYMDVLENFLLSFSNSLFRQLQKILFLPRLHTKQVLHALLIIRTYLFHPIVDFFHRLSFHTSTDKLISQLPKGIRQDDLILPHISLSTNFFLCFLQNVPVFQTPFYRFLSRFQFYCKL